MTKASNVQARESRYTSLVLSELRLTTKAKHDILDKIMPLAKSDANLADYVNHLQILSAWLTPLEKWLARFTDGPQSQATPGFMCYSNALQVDLNEAGITSAIPTHTATWPNSENSAYRWGISYVIEGSQLGGEFLYKRLSTRLAPHKLGYLQNKHTGRWNEFLQAIAVNVTTSTQIANACAGAIDAFDALLLELRA